MTKSIRTCIISFNHGSSTLEYVLDFVVPNISFDASIGDDWNLVLNRSCVPPNDATSRILKHQLRSDTWHWKPPVSLRTTPYPLTCLSVLSLTEDSRCHFHWSLNSTKNPKMFKQCQTWEWKDARHLSQQRVSSITPEQILLSLPPTDPFFFSPQSLYIHQAKYVFIPKCLQMGSVCLPQSLSVCVLCILFVDSAAASHPSCIQTSQAQSFSPLGLLRDRFNCGGIFTKPSKQPHRNWQARQNCSHDTPRSQKRCTQRLPACLEQRANSGPNKVLKPS